MAICATCSPLSSLTDCVSQELRVSIYKEHASYCIYHASAERKLPFPGPRQLPCSAATINLIVAGGWSSGPEYLVLTDASLLPVGHRVMRP